MTKKNKKLGRHLEQHGNQIRVVVRVPPSLVGVVGATKLREALKTKDPLEAEREKVDVVRRLREQLAQARLGIVGADLTEQALRWRDAIVEDDDEREGGPDEVAARHVLNDRVEEVERKHGAQAARQFAAVALGVATPVRSLLDRFFAENRDFSVGYVEDVKRSITRLEEWCADHRTGCNVESLSKKIAAGFVHDTFIVPNVDPATANKTISCLMSYWRWLGKRYDVQPNPWSGQRVTRRVARAVADRRAKRPFTDDEAAKLLNGIELQRERDFSIIAALSGLRINEIANLLVKDCADGQLSITKSKTPSGLRAVPTHAALLPVIARRTAGKKPDEYLFDDLPAQRPGSKRDRSAPVTQAFTRERRRLGVEEKSAEGQRQSNIDFHSWRRWFTRKALEALERGAPGFTPWTIAGVLGHRVEKGAIEGEKLPLGMTMGRYPGPAAADAMRACVDAVKLPANASAEELQSAAE